MIHHHIRSSLNQKEVEQEGKDFLEIIIKLVKWENTNNEELLNLARTEIKRYWQLTCDQAKDNSEFLRYFNKQTFHPFMILSQEVVLYQWRLKGWV